ncbi:MAG: L,D-transpeptidase [Bacteroidales bacterium]|nr:L,D-transpeptidase [Bacteroidales bacterium]
MKRWRRGIIWFAVIITVLAFLIVGFIKLIPEPPAKEIEMARQALLTARESKAEVYAKDIFKEANRYYDSAMDTWQAENKRFILFRDYSSVVRLSGISAEKSEAASKDTKSHANDLEQRTKKLLGSLNNILKELNNTYARFPLPKKTRSAISKGKLLVSEGQVAFRNGSLIEAEKKVAQAETLLKNAHNEARNLIYEYFENHRQWKVWMDQTIAESKKKNSTVIIVDKFASKCFVYKKGKKTAEFDAELGKNWVGDKSQRGDYATPEGRYRVTQKKEGRSTKYYKALLIDYPNADDKKRFKSAIDSGKLPRNTHIGGLIEIHGHGGKGADWTEGCVALTDSDMDKLYRLVSVGTPVTIIGSIANLDSILNNQF